MNDGKLRSWGMLGRARTSLRGFALGWRADRAVRDLWLALGAGWLLLAIVGVAPGWWVFVIVASAVALALEHLNTAIEALLDRLHPAHDPAIGMAKDLASAAAFAGNVAAAVAILAAAVLG